MDDKNIISRYGPIASVIIAVLAFVASYGGLGERVGTLERDRTEIKVRVLDLEKISTLRAERWAAIEATNASVDRRLTRIETKLDDLKQ